MSIRSFAFQSAWTRGVLAFALTLLGVSKILTVRSVSWSDSSTENFKTLDSTPTIANSSVLQINCPKVAEDTASERLEEEEFNWYHEHSEQIKTNVTTFLTEIRDVPDYDDWGLSYQEVKDGMFLWKKNRFVELKSGAAIYESACGIGLNLFMTLEILYDEYGVENITVYGNDYVAESVEIAEAIVKAGLLPGNGKLGGLCASDSSQLPFVPSNAFDLVFTGYLTPLQNPLQLNTSTITNTTKEYYVELCEGDAEQSNAAQEIQNDWYAQWVGEMIRIAKPGSPIIVEQVSYPICENRYDWGGVSADFWSDAVEKYKWDVDRGSIEMEDDEIFERYNVLLRKNHEVCERDEESSSWLSN